MVCWLVVSERDGGSDCSELGGAVSEAAMVCRLVGSEEDEDIGTGVFSGAVSALWGTLVLTTDSDSETTCGVTVTTYVGEDGGVDNAAAGVVKGSMILGKDSSDIELRNIQ